MRAYYYPMSICWNHFYSYHLEALGGMSSLAANTIAKIRRLLGQRLGLSPQEPTRHLFQRLSVSLWRGNAALWIHRSPFLPLSWMGFLDSLFVFFFLFFVLFCLCVCVHLCFPWFSLFCLCLAFFFFSFFSFFYFHGQFLLLLYINFHLAKKITSRRA